MNFTRIPSEVVSHGRLGLRLASRNPVFALTLILVFAIGIGANTAVFSLINTLLLRPLPVQAPDRLIAIYATNKEHKFWSTSYPDYASLRDQNSVFSGVAGYTIAGMSLQEDGKSKMVWGEMVTGNYFSVLGVTPIRGRAFLPEEDRVPMAAPVAVISHDLWQNQFNSRPDIVGANITLNGYPFRIVGVAPSSFQGLVRGLSAKIWVPMMMQGRIKPGPNVLEDRKVRLLSVVARLKDGAEISAARANVALLADQLASAYPDTDKGWSSRLIPQSSVAIHPEADGALAVVASLLMAFTLLILLVACSNAANLTLARMTSREKEFAIRMALGSSRMELVRQIALETLPLATIGAILGTAVTLISLNLLLGSIPLPSLPINFQVQFDGRVAAFAFLAAIFVSFIFGLAPVFKRSRGSLSEVLTDKASGSGRRPHSRIQDALVFGQMAASMILLICGALFLLSLHSASSIDPGFRTNQLLMLSVNPVLKGYEKPRAAELYQRMLEETRRQPGVTSAALASHLPLGVEIRVADVYSPQSGDIRQDKHEVDYSVVGPGYFETVGTPLLQGRDFTDQDNDKTPGVVIVNETMAERFWHGQNPLNQKIALEDPSGPSLQVVGVVRDGKYRTLGESPRPFLFKAAAQDFQSPITLLVHTNSDAGPMLNTIQRQILSLDPTLPIFEAKTVEQHLGTPLLLAKAGAFAFGLMGFLALGLAMTGITGLVAYQVGQRTREIAIKISLGARRVHVIRPVVLRMVAVSATGALVGLALAALLARQLSGVLYGSNSAQIIVLLAVPTLLLLLVTLASYVPVWRATQVDPAVALRG
ncbi:MAG TPA: ABC transporter permease [Candidatus Angelobacter sp.]|nr:ABC transporter permease [Candidatus Angelobacter sp.]